MIKQHSNRPTLAKRWLPFHASAAKGRGKAKLQRLQRKGFTPPGDKQSLRQAAAQAAVTHPITKV